jgi:hypothetical protein
MMGKLDDIIGTAMIYSIVGSPAASVVTGAIAGYCAGQGSFSDGHLALMAAGAATPALAYGWFGYMHPHGNAKGPATIGAMFGMIGETAGFAAGYVAGRLV